ncbi:MAG: hypothetical protein SWK76_16890 [Actinomycetota bacterium]|nr:hypothetical protein [Actinomycetota bacterium]
MADTLYNIQFDIKSDDFEASVINQGRNLVFHGMVGGRPFRKTVPEEASESFVDLLEQLIRFSLENERSALIH